MNSPEDGPVGPKHVEIRQYMNKIEIVTSVGFYSIYPYEELIPAVSQCNACGKYSSRKYNFIFPDVCILCELKHTNITDGFIKCEGTCW